MLGRANLVLARSLDELRDVLIDIASLKLVYVDCISVYFDVLNGLQLGFELSDLLVEANQRIRGPLLSISTDRMDE